MLGGATTTATATATATTCAITSCRKRLTCDVCILSGLYDVLECGDDNVLFWPCGDV